MLQSTLSILNVFIKSKYFKIKIKSLKKKKCNYENISFCPQEYYQLLLTEQPQHTSSTIDVIFFCGGYLEHISVLLFSSIFYLQ